jgi:hypothetical protein
MEATENAWGWAGDPWWMQLLLAMALFCALGFAWRVGGCLAEMLFPLIHEEGRKRKRTP